MQNIIIKPIRTEEDYERALEQIYPLMNAEEGSEEGEILEVLSILIENYEDKHYPIDAPDPVEAIKFRMEQKSINVTQLGEIIGYKSRASEILNRKRKLTLKMIRNISDKLNIPAEILVKAY